MTTIKDLGLIAGVIRSATPIANKEILWRDTTSSSLKYYDEVLAVWVPLTAATYHAVATTGNFDDLNDGTLAQVLAKGFVSGANDISMDDGQVIKATNGDSHLDLRYGGINSQARLHAEEELRISTNFRKKIIIGADNHPTVDSPILWTQNQTYQQVQAHNVALKGYISIGNITSATSASVIYVGTDKTQLRWDRLFLISDGATKIGIQHRGVRFTFEDINGDPEVYITRTAGFGTELRLTKGQQSTALSVSASTALVMEQSYWDGAVAVDREFSTDQERWDDAGTWRGRAFIEYATNRMVQFYEDNKIEITAGAFGIGIKPDTHKLQVLGGNIEDLILVGNITRPQLLSLNNIGQTHFSMLTGTGGVSIGGQTVFSRIHNAVLSVWGNFCNSGVASFGNSGTIGNTVNAPAGWKYSVGPSHFIDDTANARTRIQTNSNTLAITNSANTVAGESITIGGQKTLKTFDVFNASATQLSTTNELILNAKYWDGALVNNKQYFRRFIAFTTGLSQLEHTVDGTLVQTLHNSGVTQYPEFTIATLPIPVAGGVIIITDEVGGRTMATGDGVNWRRSSDGNIAV